MEELSPRYVRIEGIADYDCASLPDHGRTDPSTKPRHVLRCRGKKKGVEYVMRLMMTAAAFILSEPDIRISETCQLDSHRYYHSYEYVMRLMMTAAAAFILSDIRISETCQLDSHHYYIP